METNIKTIRSTESVSTTDGKEKKYLVRTHEQNSQVGDCKAEEKIVGGGVHTLVPEDISTSIIIIIFHLISSYPILSHFYELALILTMPNICQFWYITALCRLVKSTPKNSRQNSQSWLKQAKICILLAINDTGLKKIHHYRLSRL